MTEEKPTPTADQPPPSKPAEPAPTPSPPASPAPIPRPSGSPALVLPVVEGDGAILPPAPTGQIPIFEQELRRSQQILTANGFGDTPAAWRQASGHADSLIRVAAYLLLTQPVSPSDANLFRQGVGDDDESVRALAAYGLARLGDDSARATLTEIAGLDVNAYLGAPRAAGLLAHLGDPSGFETLLRAQASDLSVIRLLAVQNAPAFVELHGQPYRPNHPVDIWAFYAQALQDPDANVRQTAHAQLQALDSPQAAGLLQE